MEPEYEAPQLIETSPEDENAPELTLEKRVWGFWPTVGFSLAIGFMILIAQLVLILGLMFSNLSIEAMTDAAVIEEYILTNMGLLIGLGTLISGVIGIAGIVGVIAIRRGVSVTEYLGLRRISLKQIAWLLLITLVLVAAFDGLSLLLKETVETGFDTWMYDTSAWPVLIWLAVVVFAPLQEELFFRGFLLVGLRNSRLGAVGAVVITSLFWAGLHVQYNLYLMGLIFVMGLVLGYVRLRTKSLWSPLLVHAANNLVAMLLMTYNMENLFK